MTSSIVRVLALAAVVALLATSRVLAFDRQARGAADGRAHRHLAIALMVGCETGPGAATASAAAIKAD
jgi:hypothetical protein